MSASGLIIAGTDTDVGKTYAAAAILAWLRLTGYAAAPMKPVQTGAEQRADGSWAAPDLDFCLSVSGLEVDGESYAHMAPNCFTPAASPHLAARLSGGRVDRSAIHASLAWLVARYDRVIVEGAGGLLVPLDPDSDSFMVDLFAELGWPVLLVGRAGLGTLNHTLLSLEALARRGIPVAGTLLVATSEPSDADWLVRDNWATLNRLASAPCFGLLDHQPTVTRTRMAAAVAACPALTAYLHDGGQ